jgi:hypothetical protein
MATVVECARHPGVETALRCNRCDTPICPRCMVISPVGAKCKDCGKALRSPVYRVGPTQFARAAGAAIVGGVVMGLIWGAILLPFSFGLLSIFLGAGLGYAFTRLLEFASGRKRGPMMIGLAVMGIGIAWAMTLFFVDLRLASYGLFAAGIGVYFAYLNLR